MNQGELKQKWGTLTHGLHSCNTSGKSAGMQETPGGDRPQRQSTPTGVYVYMPPTPRACVLEGTASALELTDCSAIGAGFPHWKHVDGTHYVSMVAPTSDVTRPTWISWR